MMLQCVDVMDSHSERAPTAKHVVCVVRDVAVARSWMDFHFAKIARLDM